MTERAVCEWCGAEADVTTTCPKSIACPTCKAQPGHPCKRPSGHKAAQLHADRVQKAETA